jgi:Domain of unknown function (DUF1996)
LRDVRLIASNGASVMTEAFGSVPCAAYGFNNQDPAPNVSQRCEYAGMKMHTLSNPNPGSMGMGSSITVAMGSRGASGQRTRNASGSPFTSDGSGSFRTTCSLTDFQFNDPIVNPGRANVSPLHIFFGNTGVDQNSTANSVANSGNSSCRGGTLNRTAYYFPAVIDSRNGEVQTPMEGTFYYKTGYNIDPTTVRAFPAGLIMIAGDKNARGIQLYQTEWGCRSNWRENDGMIQNCPIGDAVRLTVHFPQCWDGRNLDSPDHRSHVAYPIYRNAPERSTCPPSHPVVMPQVTEIIDFEMRAGSSPQTWRLSTDNYSTNIRGGLSAHAQWIEGWDRWTMNTIVTGCLNRALDCGVGLIGNGTELF